MLAQTPGHKGKWDTMVEGIFMVLEVNGGMSGPQG